MIIKINSANRSQNRDQRQYCTYVYVFLLQLYSLSPSYANNASRRHSRNSDFRVSRISRVLSQNNVHERLFCNLIQCFYALNYIFNINLFFRLFLSFKRFQTLNGTCVPRDTTIFGTKKMSQSKAYVKIVVCRILVNIKLITEVGESKLMISCILFKTMFDNVLILL